VSVVSTQCCGDSGARRRIRFNGKRANPLFVSSADQRQRLVYWQKLIYIVKRHPREAALSHRKTCALKLRTFSNQSGLGEIKIRDAVLVNLCYFSLSTTSSLQHGSTSSLPGNALTSVTKSTNIDGTASSQCARISHNIHNTLRHLQSAKICVSVPPQKTNARHLSSLCTTQARWPGFPHVSQLFAPTPVWLAIRWLIDASAAEFQDFNKGPNPRHGKDLTILSSWQMEIRIPFDDVKKIPGPSDLRYPWSTGGLNHGQTTSWPAGILGISWLLMIITLAN